MLINILLNIHVVGGTLLLILGLSQIIWPKFGMRHVRVGQLYVALMLVVCMTAMYVSLQRLQESGEHGGHVFLLMMSLFSLYGTISGYMLGKFKHQRGLFLGRVMVVYGVLVGLFMLTITLYYWSLLGMIAAVFTLLQMMGTIQDARHHFQLQKEMPHGPRFWIFGHAGRMMGSYIACVTAFLVNVVPCPYPIVLWLGPTFIGGALIIWFNKRLARGGRK
jgi:hypothetical protein